MNLNNVISLIVGGTALTAFTRVKVGASAVILPADSGDKAIGTVLQDMSVGRAGDVQVDKPAHYGIVATDDAIAAGDEIAAADGGNIQALGQGTAIGVALQDSGGAGSVIRYLPY